MTTPVTRWTTAPDVYDGFGTASVETSTWNGRALRRVEIDPDHVDWQVGRYASGLFRTWDEDPRLAEQLAAETAAESAAGGRP